jgi:hypothetical protein
MAQPTGFGVGSFAVHLPTVFSNGSLQCHCRMAGSALLNYRTDPI